MVVLTATAIWTQHCASRLIIQDPSKSPHFDFLKLIDQDVGRVSARVRLEFGRSRQVAEVSEASSRDHSKISDTRYIRLHGLGPGRHSVFPLL